MMDLAMLEVYSFLQFFSLSTGSCIYEIVNFCSDLSQSGLDLC